MLRASQIKILMDTHTPFARAFSYNHFQHYSTQSPRMHAFIPLAKRLACMKTSLPLNSEASLGVYY